MLIKLVASENFFTWCVHALFFDNVLRDQIGNTSSQNDHNIIASLIYEYDLSLVWILSFWEILPGKGWFVDAFRYAMRDKWETP